MQVKPILFSAPMVRANIREVQQPGTGKTQTRRVLKPQPELFICSDTGLECEVAVEQNRNDPRPRIRLGRVITKQELPYAVGDVLWVRETWTQHHPAGVQEGRFSLQGEAGIPGPPPVSYRVIYKADGDPIRVWHCDGFPYRTAAGPRDEINARYPDICSEMPGWTPSIHMPRWASRLTLEVTDVRVERLQDISASDAEAEGVVHESADPPFYYVPGIWPHSLTAVGVEEPGGKHAQRSYAKLWDHINGAGAWDANPWVVAVTYRPHLMNVDAFLAQRVAA